MANYSYTSNGIVFDIQGNDVLQFQKLANQNSSFKRGDIVHLINAVEIDWNGADLGNSYQINTTGELLSYLSSINAKLDNLIYILNSI